jgi:hypothetical protein
LKAEPRFEPSISYYTKPFFITKVNAFTSADKLFRLGDEIKEYYISVEVGPQIVAVNLIPSQWCEDTELAY